MEGPFTPLAVQMARLQVAEQGCAVERWKAQVLELVDRHRKNVENIAAAGVAIAQLTDGRTDSKVQEQKRRMLIAAQQHTIERQRLENLEGAERVAKLLEQIDASRRAMVDAQANLQAMEQAHGALTEDQFAALAAGVSDG